MKVDTTHCDDPPKAEFRTKTPWLSTLRRAFGFPKVSNEEQQFALVASDEISSSNFGTSSYSLSVMSGTTQTCRMKGTNGMFRFFDELEVGYVRPWRICKERLGFCED